MPWGVDVSLDAITSGRTMRPYLNTAFTRFHESIEQYPAFLDDIDDIALDTTDDFERTKMFKAKKGTTVGDASIIPMDDDDMTFKWNNVYGENVYSCPPGSNSPTIDHGLEEDKVWAFRKSTNNQDAIINNYIDGPDSASQKTHAPFWGAKLGAPAFFKQDKLDKMYKQW